MYAICNIYSILQQLTSTWYIYMINSKKEHQHKNIWLKRIPLHLLLVLSCGHKSPSCKRFLHQCLLYRAYVFMLKYLVEKGTLTEPHYFWDIQYPDIQNMVFHIPTLHISISIYINQCWCDSPWAELKQRASKSAKNMHTIKICYKPYNRTHGAAISKLWVEDKWFTICFRLVISLFVLARDTRCYCSCYVYFMSLTHTSSIRDQTPTAYFCPGKCENTWFIQYMHSLQRTGTEAARHSISNWHSWLRLGPWVHIEIPKEQFPSPTSLAHTLSWN